MERLRKLSNFLLQSVALGLAAAFLVVLVRPDLLPGRSDAPATTAADPTSYAAAVQRTAPAVVNVHAATRVQRGGLLSDPFFRQFFGEMLPAPQERIDTSLGSGVIVDADGLILTNNHVIDGAESIRVALSDGRVAEAELVGADPETDIAVLRTELRDLPVAELSTETRLAVGDVVLAVGNPFGFGQTVTQGIISATGRSQLGLTTFENFIQTDAAINPGNSGGALIDAYGTVVGINTAMFSRSGGSTGIGFAIPASLARAVMDQLVAHGRVIRGWLGIEPQDLTAALAETLGSGDNPGVAVMGVYRGGPAHNAGLRAGDVITAIDDNPVRNRLEALREITGRPPGSRLRLTGLRQGEAFEYEVVVGERPTER